VISGAGTGPCTSARSQTRSGCVEAPGDGRQRPVHGQRVPPGAARDWWRATNPWSSPIYFDCPMCQLVQKGVIRR